MFCSFFYFINFFFSSNLSPLTHLFVVIDWNRASWNIIFYAGIWQTCITIIVCALFYAIGFGFISLSRFLSWICGKEKAVYWSSFYRIPLALLLLLILLFLVNGNWMDFLFSFIFYLNKNNTNINKQACSLSKISAHAEYPIFFWNIQKKNSYVE